MSDARPLTSSSAPRLSAALDAQWHLTVAFQVDGPEADELWQMYERSFSVLRTRAAQRHLMSRDEFSDLLLDSRIDKIVIRSRPQDEQVACLATLCNDFAAVPLVSPDYYRQQWPEEFAEGRIWYVGFIAVATPFQGSTVMGATVRYLTEVASRDGGVLAADFCEFNEEQTRISSALTRLSRNFNPGVRRRRLDSQQYWAFEFPRRQSAPVDR